MERNNLICMLVGWYSARNPNIQAEDLKIEIDNALLKSHFTPLGTGCRMMQFEEMVIKK